jgi:GTP cyclohydrolase I
MSVDNPITTDERIDVEKAQEGTRLLLEAIGEDPGADPYTETWQRRVPEALATLTTGSREDEKPHMRTFEAETNELVIKSGIPFHSLCKHHLLPYSGQATVAYRPGDEMVGLSKLSRYVRWQSRQLTTQEEVTEEIATGLRNELDAKTVMVEIAATHLCEAMRGVTTETETTTRAVAGEPTASERRRFNHAVTQ